MVLKMIYNTNTTMTKTRHYKPHHRTRKHHGIDTLSSPISPSQWSTLSSDIKQQIVTVDAALKSQKPHLTYLVEQAGRNWSEETRRQRRSVALRESAVALVQHYAGKEQWSHVDMARLLAAYPGWVEAIEQDDTALTRQENKRRIKKLTHFNHALRDVIDNATHACETWKSIPSVSDIVNGLEAVCPGNKHARSKQDRKDMLYATVVGIRNEVLFMRVLDEAGIAYEPGTANQDVRGIDMIVNGKLIDLKSSEYYEYDAQEDAAEHDDDGRIFFFPGVEGYEYRNKLMLPKEKIIRFMPRVVARMYSHGILD
mgnify:CR=1 FL=1